MHDSHATDLYAMLSANDAASFANNMTLPDLPKKILKPPYQQDLLTLRYDKININWVNWDEPHFIRWAFVNCDKFLNTQNFVNDPKHIAKMPYQRQDLSGITFENYKKEKITLRQYLDNNYVDGIAVAQKGKILFEEYFAFMQQDSRHLLQSVTKSLVASVALALKSLGVLDTERLITDILPELQSSAYGTSTIQHALDMRTSVDCKNTYGLPEHWDSPMTSDSFLLDVANCWKPQLQGYELATDNFSYLKKFNKQRYAPGHDLYYHCQSTEVVMHCLEKVTGKKFATLLSELIWQPMGAEYSGFITIDTMGNACGSGGGCVTLRDLLKFGQLMIQEGSANGKQLIKPEWVWQCYSPAPYHYPPNHPELGHLAGYKNFFWIVRAQPKVIMGSGVFGQSVYMQPDKEIAIALFSTQPSHLDDNKWQDIYSCLDAIAAALS